VAEVLFDTADFTFYQDSLLNNLLQLFTHTEIQNGFLYSYFLRSTSFLNRNKHIWKQFFYEFALLLTLYTLALPVFRHWTSMQKSLVQNLQIQMLLQHPLSLEYLCF